MTSTATRIRRTAFVVLALLLSGCAGQATQGDDQAAEDPGPAEEPAAEPAEETEGAEPAEDTGDAEPAEDTGDAEPAEDTGDAEPAEDTGVDVSDLEATRPERRDLAEPTEVRIPAIDVVEPLNAVGYNSDRTMEVPDFGDTAWFDGQPKPGERGASVITGHVDSREGPDVFFNLGDLDLADRVEVDLADETTVTYEVIDIQEFPKDDLPHELIYGHTSRDTLRLITCDGLFDQAEGSYEDNLVVFAEVVEADA